MFTMTIAVCDVQTYTYKRFYTTITPNNNKIDKKKI